MIKFEEPNILVNKTKIPAKAHHEDMIADVYQVPKQYRENELFIGYRTENGPKEIPACREYEFLGSVEVPADEQAILENSKDAKINYLSQLYEDCAKQLESTYPESERASWTLQSQEAKAYLENPEIDAKWLSAAAAARGVSIQEMAQLVSNMDDEYRITHGTLTGTRQKIRNDILEAQTLEELQEIKIKLSISI